jgi:LAS superfamily LD-carboxypeptidase LdcB
MHDLPRARAGRRPALALLLTSLALAALACTAPATPDNKPTVPAGRTNGALPASMLTTVSNCLVATSAANSLREMLAAAAAAKVNLYGGSCYRNYAGQVAAREAWCEQGACQMAAVPGTSNHGWGKAIDFGSNAGMTFESPAYKWLKEFAWVYGWNHPAWAGPTGSAPEPWHWEWVGDGGTLFPGQIRGPQ